MERMNNWVAAVLSAEGGNCIGLIRGTRRMSRVRYAACMFATKSALGPKGLEVLDVWDELSSHRTRSSGGACVRGPEGAGASEIAGLAMGTAGCRGAGVGAGGVRG